MNDLFRFHVLRDALPDVDLAVDLAIGASDSELLQQLSEAQTGDDPRQAMLDAATAFAGSEEFLGDPLALELTEGIAKFADALSREPDADLAQMRSMVEKSFGSDASGLVDSREFRNDWGRLRDTLIAVKLVPDAAPPLLDDLVNAARLLSFVTRIASDDQVLDRTGTAAMARAMPLKLPELAVLPSQTPFVETLPAIDSSETESEQRALVERVIALRSAIETLRGIRSQTFKRDVAVEEEGQPGHALRSGGLSEASLFRAIPDIRFSQRADITRLELQGSERTLLTPGITADLPAVARELLADLDDGGGTMTLFSAESKLYDGLKEGLSTLKGIGLVDAINIGPSSAWGSLHIKPVTEPGEHDDALDPPPATLTDVPKSHGSIKPAGIGDLLVTRQHTLRYEMGEIAHIENIAPNEQLNRETRRLDSTETTQVYESEIIQSDERDLQSTARFGLNQETDHLLKQDVSRIPGQPSSESYGSLVESAGTKQSSQKVAETYSRDITNRANSRVTQRTRSQLTTRVLRELEEKAIHSFSAADDAQIVVYQWVDRIVQAQVYTYGKRLFYDIVIPEPAGFLVRTLESPTRSIPLPPRPAPFKLEPTMINEWNWDYYVAGYGAAGVTPPPPSTVTVSRTFQGIAQNRFSGNAETDTSLMAAGIDITIPDGYAAAEATAKSFFVQWAGFEADLTLVIGKRYVRLNFANPSRTSPLDFETGAIPLTVLVDAGLPQFTIAIEITCELTDDAFARWQTASHAAILAASRDRLAEYEQRVSNLQAALRLLTSGRSAERKAVLIRNELEKASLAIITNQQFDGLSAVSHSPQGYPQPYLPNVEQYGRYLRFLEHAFEWEQMTWRYAPYFWGRKPYWMRTLLRDDVDPALADFLHAGAARVLVPVRPGFEASILAFMADGTVPTSESLSSIVSPLYLPLLQELGQPDTALDDGLPYSDPWEIRLPTTLVALRRDGTLPRWKQKSAADGTVEWVTAPGDPVP